MSEDIEARNRLVEMTGRYWALRDILVIMLAHQARGQNDPRSYLSEILEAGMAKTYRLPAASAADETLLAIVAKESDLIVSGALNLLPPLDDADRP